MTLLDEALQFAVERHSGQTRKLCNAPYILHPIEVAAIVGTMTDDQETLAAAVLHDTVEDTDTTLEELRERFGKRVALLVMTETENKRPELPESATWRIRKEETLVMLENTKDLSVKMMWLGDKLSNIRSFYREYRAHGLSFLNSFNQKDPKQQAWYYYTILKSLAALKEYDAYREFEFLVREIFRSIDEGDTYLNGTQA